MGRAGARGAMRQLADQMQGPVEREHPMMAMVTRGQRPAARPAPPLLDSQFDAIDPDGTACRVGALLRELFRTAQRLGAFINIDMESYDAGNGDDVASLLDDLEKEMSKIGSR